MTKGGCARIDVDLAPSLRTMAISAVTTNIMVMVNQLRSNGAPCGVPVSGSRANAPSGRARGAGWRRGGERGSGCADVERMRSGCGGEGNQQQRTTRVLFTIDSARTVEGVREGVLRAVEDARPHRDRERLVYDHANDESPLAKKVACRPRLWG